MTLNIILYNYSSNSPESRGPVKRRTHSDDIKQRMQLLEDSMTKQKWTRDVEKPIDKVSILLMQHSLKSKTTKNILLMINCRDF